MGSPTPEFFAKLFDTAADAMLLVDATQHVRFANPAAAILFGQPLNALQGISLDQLIPGRFREIHRAHVDRFGRTGKTERAAIGHQDVVGLKADGSEIQLGAAISTFVDQGERWFSVSLRDIRVQKRLEQHLQNAKQTSDQIVGERTQELQTSNDALTREVARRAEAETLLQDRERRFSAVFNNAYSFLGLLSPEGMLLEANQQALLFFDLTPNDVVGQPFWETPWWRYSPEARERLKAGIQEAAKGKFVRFEMQDHDPKDGIIDVDFSLSPVMDEYGKVVFLVPEGHRITELKKAQRQLQDARDSLEATVKARTAELSAAHSLLATVLSSVDEGIVAFDQELRVILWNRFIEDVTHMPFEQIKGKRTWEIWPELRTFGIDTLVQRAFQGETVVQDFLIARESKTGKILKAAEVPTESDSGVVWLLTKYTPLREGGRITGVIGTSLNVSKLAQTQARLHATNEKLRSLNLHVESVREDERRRIANGIHDGLGGLITGIRAHVGTYIESERQANRAVDTRLQRACELADSAADAVRRVIADLRPSVLDQLGIWAALEWLTKEVTDAAAIHGDCVIASEVTELELTDKCGLTLFRMTQEALTNIVRHAEAKHAHVSIEMDNGEIIVAIEDDGKGISESELVRSDAWGLIGMRERVEQLGGRLYIERARSGGTLVVFTCPKSSGGAH